MKVVEDGSEDIEFDKLYQQGEVFHKYNGKCTCKSCGYAMPFTDSVVCGVWHVSFNIYSFRDQYITQEERKAELDKRKEELLADPNSFINRFKKKK